jgi:hypothetical protein
MIDDNYIEKGDRFIFEKGDRFIFQEINLFLSAHMCG